MMLDLHTITSAETGHMTERLTPSKNQCQEYEIVRTKMFQFETLFCHVTTNEILHMNGVFSLVLLNHVEMNQKKVKLLSYKMWMDICVHILHTKACKANII